MDQFSMCNGNWSACFIACCDCLKCSLVFSMNALHVLERRNLIDCEQKGVDDCGI